MASIQLRDLTVGAKFVLDGCQGEVTNLNSSEVTVSYETEPGSGQFVEKRMAPGTEVKLSTKTPEPIPKTSPPPAATNAPDSPQLPQEETKPVSVTRRPSKAPKARKGRKVKEKMTTKTAPKAAPKNGAKKKAPKSTNPTKKSKNGGQKATKKATAKKEPVPREQHKSLQGLSKAAALRYMGAKGYTAATARAIFDKLKIPVAQNTLVSQISSGKNYKEGGFQGDVPKLKKDQKAALDKTLESATPKSMK